LPINNIYLASSWANECQPAVLSALREAGFSVYNFKHPALGQHGFSWSEIEEDWHPSPADFIRDLDHPAAKRGFALDFDTLAQADAGVLLLPCGRSAHLEAGYIVGATKPLFILLDRENFRVELMYKMATGLATTLDELLDQLRGASCAS
jgi:nucleoside 2-deoxyribosyltransferase